MLCAIPPIRVTALVRVRITGRNTSVFMQPTREEVAEARLVAAEFFERERRRSTGPPSWQPVVDVTRLDRMGLELHVTDDDDAIGQLDGLAEVFQLPRASINIKPTNGWLGYGSPELRDAA